MIIIWFEDSSNKTWSNGRIGNRRYEALCVDKTVGCMHKMIYNVWNTYQGEPVISANSIQPFSSYLESD